MDALYVMIVEPKGFANHLGVSEVEVDLRLFKT